MDDPQIRIVNLEPMRMICFSGFGEAPEELALNKLLVWAQAQGKHGRVFGFNNPNPAVGSQNYGYDVWMCVDPGFQAEGDARIIDFSGGMYAALRCAVTNPGVDIPAAWQTLVNWLDTSDYLYARHQWLEEHLDPLGVPGSDNFILDLYIPIKK